MLKSRTAVALVATAMIGASAVSAADAPKIEPVLTKALPNVPGQSITLVRVTFPPGAGSPPHRHAGSVAVYVLSGAIRSKVDAGETRVYHAGETFFEPAGALHAIAENASTSEPAAILATFVAPTGATLTKVEPK